MASSKDLLCGEGWVEVSLEDALPKSKSRSINPAEDLNSNIRRAGYEGYLERQSSILKRWKVEWIRVETGKLAS